MRYVIDIDGTICIPGPTDETRYDQALPIQDRIDEINKLYDEGHIIIYLTARGMGRHKNNANLFVHFQMVLPRYTHQSQYQREEY